MGSGKSYYADKIASLMGIPHVDLDDAIEKDQGKSISEIFSQQGEAEFRRLETFMLRKKVAALSTDETDSVSGKHRNYTGLIACGGGTPCFHDNMQWMNDHGMTIWINPPIEVLKARLKTEQAKRPLIAELNEAELNEFVEHRLQSRENYYAQATIQVTDPSMPIEQIIKKIQHA